MERRDTRGRNVKHPSAVEILTIPARRPIKPVYIRKLVRYIDEMRDSAADYLLSQAKKFRALKDAVDEGMADVEAGRVIPWDLADFLHRPRRT